MNKLHIRVTDDGKCVSCGTPFSTQPTTNGATLYAIRLPDDFRERVHQLAEERKCIPGDVLLQLALQGDRCARNHEAPKEPRP